MRKLQLFLLRLYVSLKLKVLCFFNKLLQLACLNSYRVNLIFKSLPAVWGPSVLAEWPHPYVRLLWTIRW